MRNYDVVLSRLESTPCKDADYRVALHKGRPVAVYQVNRENLVPYDDKYFDKYVDYMGKPIANRINDVRVRMVKDRASILLDVGIGSGEFLESLKGLVPVRRGFDINKKAEVWLKKNGLWFNPFTAGNENRVIDMWTFFDSIEHMPNPADILSLVRSGAMVAACLPIFGEDLIFDEISLSKHFKKNEHVAYFSTTGFIAYFDLLGFDLIENHDEEVKAGRESIGSFLFIRR